jgi:hypothetical protein
MFSFILRKGSAKDKRFAGFYHSDQDDEREMHSIAFTPKMDEDRAQDWNREAESALIAKMWQI